ncbi:PREDICTED: WD repeat-containing protein 55 homolog [Papilio polytes]|uniref:WD repeat-containing protein 55 homolog n=1 Tax=Papilio polytes TaxID=76194 RepID=UPI000675C67A|nr:PREDICTED: WD repeat-containing protein 55 homolog [Papilio polytes]
MGIEFRDLDKKSINDSDTDYSDESREIDDFGGMETDNSEEDETSNLEETENATIKTNSDLDESDGEEDEVVKAIKAEKSKPRDHPPTINCEDFIVDISFSPSKNLIALANIMGDVLLYEYKNDENKLLNTLELHVKACRDVEFNEEGDIIYTAGKDKAVIATDVETGKLKCCYENAHEEPVYKLLCLGNNKFVTGDDGGTVKLWDLRKADPFLSIKIGDEHVSDMITNESEKYLVCAGGDGVLTSIDLKGSKIYTTSEDYDSELTCMGLFRSDTKLLVGSSKGKLYLFNWKEFGLHSDEYVGQKHSLQCMVPVTQNIVVTSGEDGILRATHMFPQRQLGIVGQHSLPVECLDISHDGQFIASCSHENDVKFWNISYFETIDSLIDVNHKQNKKKDMSNNLPSSSVKNASDFFSGLV